VWEAAKERIVELTAGNRFLAIPAAAGIAPPLTADPEKHDDRRGRSLRLTSIAGLSGAPAISLPLCFPQGSPLGVCLLGAPGSDEQLLGIARRLVG